MVMRKWLNGLQMGASGIYLMLAVVPEELHHDHG
jgi:hypothetical protein